MTTQVERSMSRNSVWSVLPGLFWAGACLLILGWWMLARKPEVGAPAFIGPWLLALIALGLFAFGAWHRFKAGGDRAKIEALDTQLRPIVGVAALIGGGVLILLAVWLCFAEQSGTRLEVFAEVSTLAVLGVICLLVGLNLRSTSAGLLSQQSVLQSLLELRPSLGIGLIALSIICGAAGVFLFIRGRAEFSRFGAVEGIALVLLALALLGGGLWLQLTIDRPASKDTMRILVLYLGSMLGLVISLYAGLRLLTWWTTYLSGWITSWQGEEGWRFWFCAYIGLIGLSLLFGSLLLAQTDIHQNVAMRRTLYGYNAFLNGFLLFLVVVLLNIMVGVIWPANIQWTPSSGMYTLSSRSEQALQGLQDKVTVYVLLPRYDPTYLEVRDLLDNCRSTTNKLVVEEISPDIDEDTYRSLAEDFPKLSERSGPRDGGRGLLVVYGEGADRKKLRHDFISETDLHGMGGRGFQGEKVLMQKVVELSEIDSKKPKVYFTQGQGEFRMDDADMMRRAPSDRVLWPYSGIGDLVSRLKKDNFDVQGLVWASKPPNIGIPDEYVFSKATAKDTHEVPTDCSILVIVSPDEPFEKDVIEAIDRYMEARQGKLMVLANANILTPPLRIADDGLIELCKKYNVDMGKDFVLRFSESRSEKVTELRATVPEGAQAKAVTGFSKRAFTFMIPRTVTPKKEPGNFQAESILQLTWAANEAMWPEDEASVLTNPQGYMAEPAFRDRIRNKIASEPLSVGVAVTDREAEPRAIIIGDATFIGTLKLTRTTAGSLNYDFFRSCTSWLAKTKLPDIGISPRESGVYLVNRDQISPMRMVWLPIGLLTFALAGMGAGLWVVRRR